MHYAAKENVDNMVKEALQHLQRWKEGKSDICPRQPKPKFISATPLHVIIYQYH